MKSIHLRFEDKDFEKIQKICSVLGVSINAYLTKKFADFDLDFEQNPDLIRSKILDNFTETKLDKKAVSLIQIHHDLCDILARVEEIKSAQDDMNYELDFNRNIEPDDIDYLTKCIKNLRRTVVDSTEQICNKIDRIK